MSNRIFVFLVFLLKVNYCFSSEELSIHEQASKDPQYKNVCLIKCYKDDKFVAHATGTLMEDRESGKKYILTTSHLDNTDRLTATFEGYPECEIHDFETLVTKLNEHDNDTKGNVRFGKGADIAIGFLDSYPTDIEPAYLAPRSETSEKTKNICGYFENSNPVWLQILEDFNNMKTDPGYVVGYGSLIHPASLLKILFIQPNKELKKVAITVTAKSSRDGGIESDMFSFRPLRLESTFTGKDNSKSLEAPVRGGMSGGSLRADGGFVIGVASHGMRTPALNSSEFRTEFPKLSKTLNIFHFMSERIKDAPHYVYPTTMAIGACSYYLFDGGWMGWGALGLSAVSCKVFSYLPQIDSVLFDTLAPIGTKSYYSYLAPWHEVISGVLEKRI